jgi:hypothetical protein
MPTVDKRIADILIANDGHYPSQEEGTPPDPRVLRIVRYENYFNGEYAYGLEYDYSYGAYQESEYVRNPMTYWSAS